jgi:glycosyltransferase involved in cell wall biosynthesis
MTNKKNDILVITTHPIQYIVPWFQELQKSLDCGFNVLFLREPEPKEQGVGFGLSFEWDIPLRDGYNNIVISPKGTKMSKITLCYKIFKYLKKEKPSNVLVTGWNEPALIFSIVISKLLGIKLILRGESNDLRQRTLTKKIFHKLLLSRADAFLKIGAANERFYIKSGISSKKIFDGCYFVNNSKLIESINNTQNKEQLREKYGIDYESVVFVFVGKFIEFKQPLLLIEAASEVAKVYSNISLLFVGSGKLENEMISLANRLNVNIQFTGFLNQQELWKGYTAADAFVLPSHSEETWGLVANEALIFGLPVLVSNQIGCAEDLIISEEIGFVFNPDKMDLAKAMMCYIENKEQFEPFNKIGQDHVLKNFSMNRATNGLKHALNFISN